MNFNYYLPVNLIFGRGCSAKAGEIAASLGKKVLLVTGRKSTKKSGQLDRMISLLKQAGVGCEVFDRVESNPLTTTVEEGAQTARSTGCNVVLGLGGGSIMDAAKGMAFAAVNPGHISDYIFAVKRGNGALPLILIPTTCGTGSEGNGFAVMTNPETKDKKSLRTNDIVAKASLIDPDLMMTMPKHVLASVGFDALAHNMEAYTSKKAQPLTDIQALLGIRLLARNLKKVYDDPSDTEAWENVTLASTLGGMVINTAGVGAPHGMEHPASGLRNIVHGCGLAALTPEIVRRSYPAPRKNTAKSPNCWAAAEPKTAPTASRHCWRVSTCGLGLANWGFCRRTSTGWRKTAKRFRPAISRTIRWSFPPMRFGIFIGARCKRRVTG